MTRLLLVDDNEDFRDWLVKAVEFTVGDYIVTTATSALDALKKLDWMRPDVIVLDLHMPLMDGFEFRRRQLDDPRLADIPVVVISRITICGKSRSGWAC